jgi:hypothetical protein
MGLLLPCAACSSAPAPYSSAHAAAQPEIQHPLPPTPPHASPLNQPPPHTHTHPPTHTHTHTHTGTHPPLPPRAFAAFAPAGHACQEWPPERRPHLPALPAHPRRAARPLQAAPGKASAAVGLPGVPAERAVGSLRMWLRPYHPRWGLCVHAYASPDGPPGQPQPRRAPPCRCSHLAASPAIHAAPQVAVPTYGEWLDVYLTILKPLPLPTGGLLGERRRRPCGRAVHAGACRAYSAQMLAVPGRAPVPA